MLSGQIDMIINGSLQHRALELMRMLDVDKEQSVFRLQLYLTADEAAELHKQLERLLAAPEANEHFHVFDRDMSRELSCSILTPGKLESGGYTELEQKVFKER